MIFDALDKIKRNAIFTTILLIAAGVIVLITPLEHAGTLVLGLGYGLIILALVMALNFIGSKKSLMDYVKFVAAVAIVIFGVLILIKREDTMRNLAWIFGVLIFLDGVRTLIHSFTYARRSHRRAWWVLSIVSVIIMALGVVMFITPWYNPMFSEPDNLMKAIGGTIMFVAIASGFRLIWTWPVKKDKEAKENGNA